MEHDTEIPDAPAAGLRLVARAPQMFREATGLCIEDFMTLGFGLWAPLCVWQPGRPLMIDLRQVNGIDETMADQFFQVISRDLYWFAAELVDQGPWDFLQFESTPVIRLNGGRLALDHAILVRQQTSGWSPFFDAQRGAIKEHERLRWTSAYSAFLERGYPRPQLDP